ncbi:MAG: MutS-related protein [Stellaceae bacterium]
MKAHLLYRDCDADLGRSLPWNEAALTVDLALDTPFKAMARDDAFIAEVAKKVILAGFDAIDPETIHYRQKILQDCLQQPAVVRELYAIAVEGAMEEKKYYFFGTLMQRPDWVLRRSVELLESLLGMARKIRKIADSGGERFVSEGWTALFATLQRELDDEYFARAKHHLRQLRFSSGLLLSARLGKGNKGMRYMLHVMPALRRRWTWSIGLMPYRLMRLFARRSDAFEFSLHPRDEAGARVLAELQERGVSAVASAVAQSKDHLRSFFDMLRAELAFYVGCINLYEALTRRGEVVCFPVPAPAEPHNLSFRDLRDVSLALNQDDPVVGNDADADMRDLIIVTGANQGGKSTFLRSVGMAQLMMQAGMFVTAKSFIASTRDRLFTHYKREEDTSMESGKLDEELRQMSEIVDHITPHALILFNESFAATNEREGSEIARHIVSALLKKRVKIVCVTHLYEFARDFYEKDVANVLFLRAERQPDGSRTFKLVEGKPLETSFGEDLYVEIFGSDKAARQPDTATEKVGDR